ncbi:MAG: PTS lactose/cellobiose transporter subunit IIA, partial [Selenomonadaceae bacterium]|nr:PTS lactose/cellobiose transporter subunit IIA [Selenomonadaceae bacterium]
ANNTTKHPLPLLIIHAEDQLMSAEAFKILAQEFIDVYKRVETLEKKGVETLEKKG